MHLRTVCSSIFRQSVCMCACGCCVCVVCVTFGKGKINSNRRRHLFAAVYVQPSHCPSPPKQRATLAEMAKSQKRNKWMLVCRQTINKSKSYRKRQAAKGKPDERPITRQQAGSGSLPLFFPILIPFLPAALAPREKKAAPEVVSPICNRHSNPPFPLPKQDLLIRILMLLYSC